MSVGARVKRVVGGNAANFAEWPWFALESLRPLHKSITLVCSTFKMG